jgi:drug/metabolite transporter (DMT)-like permease
VIPVDAGRARSSLPPMTALVGALLLWAPAYAAIRAALRGFDPATLAFIRFGLGSILLAVVAAVRGSRWPRASDVGRIAAAAVLIFVLYNLGLNYGERRVGAGAASLLVATAPLFTALIARAFLRERLGIVGTVGTFIGFSGAALVATASSGAFQFDVAALAVLGAAAAEAGGFVIQKPLLDRYDPVEFNTYAIFVATVIMLPFAPAAVADLGEALPEALFAAAYLGVGPTVLAYVLWAVALSGMSASRAASFLYLVPGLAIGVAWVWLDERPSPLAILVGVVALIGVAMTNRSRQASLVGSASSRRT